MRSLHVVPPSPPPSRPSVLPSELAELFDAARYQIDAIAEAAAAAVVPEGAVPAAVAVAQVRAALDGAAVVLARLAR